MQNTQKTLVHSVSLHLFGRLSDADNPLVQENIVSSGASRFPVRHFRDPNDPHPSLGCANSGGYLGAVKVRDACG